ncbi:MAG: hypothetical protein LBN27_10470 [Prevotellaceae bacterium]|jgi:hypothetical protein|nr:hypothetical protein [Prevotellaceae bacterium]
MYKKLFVALFFFAVIGELAAQTSTNSPYTRFGYGDINGVSFSASRAMGGIGVGYRNRKAINPINPASYSAVDSMTFMFDAGGSFLYNTFTSGGTSVSKANGGFDYLNLQFPLFKFMGMSFGVTPYSAVGYNFSQTGQSVSQDGLDTVTMKRSYEGSGGINQVYGGVSAKFLNHFAAGINAYYAFGNITHYKESYSTSVTGSSTSQRNNLYVRDLRLRYGLQYFTNISDKHQLTAGAILETKTKMNGDFEFNTKGGGGLDTTQTATYGFDFPLTVGAGAYYTYNNKVSVGLDYSFQDWKNANYYGKTDSLQSASKLALGVEYLPDAFGTRLYKRIRYRAGATYSTPYIKTAEPFSNYSVTAGFGIPFRRNASTLNIGFEYGKTGVKSLIEENYFKMTLSLTFVETWFFKREIR